MTAMPAIGIALLVIGLTVGFIVGSREGWAAADTSRWWIFVTPCLGFGGWLVLAGLVMWLWRVAP